MNEAEDEFNVYNKYFTDSVLEAIGVIAGGSDGSKCLTHGTMGAYRSAIADQFQVQVEDDNYHGALWGAGIRLYSSLSNMLSGLKRETNLKKRKGEIPIREGKDAFTLDGIKLLAKKMVLTPGDSYTDSDATAWPFFTLGYNIGT